MKYSKCNSNRISQFDVYPLKVEKVLMCIQSLSSVEEALEIPFGVLCAGLEAASSPTLQPI